MKPLLTVVQHSTIEHSDESGSHIKAFTTANTFMHMSTSAVVAEFSLLFKLTERTISNISTKSKCEMQVFFFFMYGCKPHNL